MTHTAPDPTPTPEVLSEALQRALEAATRAIEGFRFIPDFGDGHPAVRMGSPEENARVAIDAAAPLLTAPFEQALAALVADERRLLDGGWALIQVTLARIAGVLHFAEGSVWLGEYRPDVCATCARAAGLFERVLQAEAQAARCENGTRHV